MLIVRYEEEIRARLARFFDFGKCDLDCCRQVSVT